MRNKFRLEVTFDKINGLDISYKEKEVEIIHNTPTRTGPRQKKYILRIIFPNNHAVCHKIVGDTLCEVVKFAGPRRVQELGIYIMGVNLVSDTLHENDRYRVGQKEVAPGLYCCTYSNTETKLQQIKQINKELNLGLRIEKVML